jgi:hypothetical protein
MSSKNGSGGDSKWERGARQEDSSGGGGGGSNGGGGGGGSDGSGLMKPMVRLEIGVKRLNVFLINYITTLKCDN